MTDQQPVLQKLLWAMGLAGHLTALIFYFSSTLLAPWWAVAVLLVIWVALLVVIVRLRTRAPAWAMAIPFADIAIWLAVISAGAYFLDWTA